MWERVGLVRDGAGLARALAELDDLRERAARIAAPPFRRFNMVWAEALDLRNLFDVARLTARAALERQESRGAHFRAEFPQSDDEAWLVNICMRRGPDDTPEVWRAPVRFTRLAPPSRQPIARPA